jgi:50S ribosomal protein L16 3-hydroxylase
MPHVLGKISPTEFLKNYWQKKPLLIRQAIPNFTSFFDKKSLLKLATRDDAEARLVQFQSGEWQLSQGPFKARDFAKLHDQWTLLLQNVNHFSSPAANLLELFNFIPYARLDDLMISFATDGGGVGPHVDSYDVFLLQGAGKRLWQIAKPKTKH